MRHRLLLGVSLSTIPVLLPTPAAALDGLGGPGAAPLVALVAVAAWVCGGWLLLVLALSVLEQGRGRGSRVARAVLPRVAPRAVRLAARLLLGTTLVTGSLGSVAASASNAGHGPAAVVPSLDWPVGPPVPSLDWPIDPALASPPTTAPTAAPTAAVPTAAVPTAATDPSPAGAPGPPAGTATSGDAGGAGLVVVQPGDCLWSLAERALGPTATPARTAAAWPLWWSANRGVIGSDPDLLQPGTRLVPPA